MLIDDLDHLPRAAQALGVGVHLGPQRRHELRWIVLFHENKVAERFGITALRRPDFGFEPKPGYMVRVGSGRAFGLQFGALLLSMHPHEQT